MWRRSVLVIAAVGLLLPMSAGPVAAANATVLIAHSEAQFPVSSLGPTTVNGPTVPAGSWWITATAEVDASTAAVSHGSVECDLIDGNSNVFDSTTRLLDIGHETGRAVTDIVLTGTFSPSAPIGTALKCLTKASGTNMTLTNIEIAAVSGGPFVNPLVETALGGKSSFPGDSAFHVVTSITLPAGTWSILAKTNVSNPSFSVGDNVTCRLAPSTADTDKNTQSLGSGASGNGTIGEIAVDVSHKFGSTTKVNFACRGDSAGGFSSDSVRIVAMKAGRLVRVPLGGSSSSTGSSTPVIFSGFRTSSVSIPSNGSLGTVASLALPAGKYFVLAKARLHDTNVRVECKLITLGVGGTEDDTTLRGDAAGSTGLYMINGIDSTAAMHAAIQCVADSAGTSLDFVRITAIKASSITITFIP